MQRYDTVEKYIEKVCNQIRNKRARSMVTQEIIDHIQDQRDAFVSDGQDEKTALSNAIKEMGDPITVGEQLDKIHRPKPDKSIIITVIILVLLQFISVGYLKNYGFELKTYILSIIVGIGALLVVYFLDYSRIIRFSPYLYFGVCLLCFMCYISNTAVRYPRSLEFYQSYYHNLLLITIYAMTIMKYKNKGYKGFIKSFLLLILGIGINLIAGKVSSLLIFCLGSGLLLFIACIKNVFNINRTISIFSFIALYGFMGIVVIINVFQPYSYFYDRLKYILNPYEYASSGGYQRVLIRKLLTNAQFVGETKITETFEGKPLYEVVPFISTDYQLTYFMSRYGYIIGIIVVLLVTFLIIRMFISTFKQKNQQGMFISLGCTIVILIQSVFYILSNFGYEIIGTISLPLLSYGNLSFIVNMIIVGLMLCTYRNDNLLDLE